MDIDELLCTLCLNQFDREDHLPLMVPKCGHTFCSKCLQDILSNLPSDQDFTCPEDQTAMKLSSRDISEFPQNLALLRLLEKKITLSIIEKQSDSLSREGRSLIIKGNKSSSDKSPDSTQDFPSPIMSPGGQNKSGSSVISGFNQQDMFYFMHGDSNLCREHMRKLEVVCLEHRCRICANCALFGSHKNHDIKPEEEVLRDIAARAEKLIDVFQVIEKSQNSTVEQETAEKVSERIRKKGDEVVRLVRQKFNDYVNVIRSKERRLLGEVAENFRKMEESLRIVKQVPQDLNEKIVGWKSRAHESLLTVTEKSEKGEIAFEMLEDRDNPKNDLLTEGEKLIIDLERSNEVSSRLFESNLSKISVTFDDNFLSNLEAFCVVEIPEVVSTPSGTIKHQSQAQSMKSLNSLNNIRDENKPDLPLGDIMNRSPKKSSTNKEDTNFRNTQTRTNNFLEPERYDRQTQSKSPSKGKAPKLMLPKTGLQKEDPYLKFESLNDKLGNSIENRFEDDHNLLNFEWKDLHTGSNIPDSLPTFNREPQRHHSHHQRQLSEDIEYRENHRDASRYDNVNTSGRLNNSKDDLQNTRGDKLNLSGKKSAGARPTSPWKKGASEGAVAKPPRSKKKSVIKVADKFEGVIEGIEQNNIDTADLTGADLGDQGVLALIEHLKENTALKSLKLLKNKLTDEGGVALAGLLNYNKTLHTINLTQNQLTEKTLDAFIEAIKGQKSIRLKLLYFSQNAMSQRNVKSKLKELAELGVNAIL